MDSRVAAKEIFDVSWNRILRLQRADDEEVRVLVRIAECRPRGRELHHALVAYHAADEPDHIRVRRDAEVRPCQLAAVGLALWIEAPLRIDAIPAPAEQHGDLARAAQVFRHGDVTDRMTDAQDRVGERARDAFGDPEQAPARAGRGHER